MTARMAGALVLTGMTFAFSAMGWVALFDNNVRKLIVGIVGGLASSGAALWVLRER